jgi:hypothetical protein
VVVVAVGDQCAWPAPRPADATADGRHSVKDADRAVSSIVRELVVEMRTQAAAVALEQPER